MPTIEKTPFGRTGYLSTRTLFGAAALGAVSQADADRTLDVLLEYGVNHIDTAASYGDSELRIGPWMDRYRDQFFLATKTGIRTYAESKEEFHRSLDRLRVSSVDLLQLHYLVKPDEWDVAMGPGGVLEMAVEAREQGLVRYIGVTGHDVSIAEMHRRSLERFDFDSILLPYNYPMMQNPRYAADFERVVTLAQERNVAVQCIKGLTRAPWGDQPHTHATWYEPLSDQADIDRAVWWIFGREGFFLNTPGDIHLLPKVLDAASRYQQRPTDADMQAMLQASGMAPLFT